MMKVAGVAEIAARGTAHDRLIAIGIVFVLHLHAAGRIHQLANAAEQVRDIVVGLASADHSLGEVLLADG